jgi:arrestin (S-antigen)-like protein
MRSRPTLKLYLVPGRAVPGERLTAELVVTSRSSTPVEAIDVSLRGSERRYTNTVTSGDITMTQSATAELVSLGSRITPRGEKLAVGEHRFKIYFDLPAGLPPTYTSQLTQIAYVMVVHVHIPWWPDRREEYSVPVTCPPLDLAGQPRLHATHRRPPGDALYLEASIENDVVEVGGSIAGAVSVQGSRITRIRRLEAALVAEEVAVVSAATKRFEAAAWRAVVHEGAPADGEEVPFRIAVPADATPAFRSGFVEVRWQLQLRAVVALGRDVTLVVPMTITVPGGRAAPDSKRLRKASRVGRERRAGFWSVVAREHGLAYDGENERITTIVGDHALVIAPETREDAGLWAAATASWPDLGIDLEVMERRWVDAFKRAVEIDPDLDKRLTVRAREPEQVRAFFDQSCSRALLAFEAVAVDDEGFVLASSRGAHEADDLRVFVRQALNAALAFSSATARIPMPAAMARHRPAWQAFAERVRGRLGPGAPAVTGDIGGTRLVVATRWNESGQPDHTEVRVAMARPLEQAIDRSAAAELSPAVRALVEQLDATAAEGRAQSPPVLGADEIVVHLPAPLRDPATIEPILERMVMLSRALAGASGGSPYRR